MYSKRVTIIFLSTLVLVVSCLALAITWHFLRPFAFAVILAVRSFEAEGGYLGGDE